MLWNGHINVQYVTSDGLAYYVTKYISKHEPLSVLTEGQDATQRHILARRMGAHEVIVLTTGKYVFRSSTGSVYIPITLPQFRNFTARPPWQIEEHDENDEDHDLDNDEAFYPDGIQKYFNRPRTPEYEDLTIFDYFSFYVINASRQGNRLGNRDETGYWIYQRQKPTLVRTAYRRLCDGEVFFFYLLMKYHHWRLDDEIFGAYHSRQVSSIKA